MAAATLFARGGAGNFIRLSSGFCAKLVGKRRPPANPARGAHGSRARFNWPMLLDTTPPSEG